MFKLLNMLQTIFVQNLDCAMQSPKTGFIYVVYFDQLLGAVCNLKLVKLLFSAVFNLFCSFQTFFSDFTAEINKKREVFDRLGSSLVKCGQMSLKVTLLRPFLMEMKDKPIKLDSDVLGRTQNTSTTLFSCLIILEGWKTSYLLKS